MKNTSQPTITNKLKTLTCVKYNVQNAIKNTTSCELRKCGKAAVNKDFHALE